MPAHDCGGWCSTPEMRLTVEATLAGQSTRAIAKALGAPVSTVNTRVALARKRGCVPPYTGRTKHPRQMPPKDGLCAWCRKAPTTKRARYCSENCASAGYKAGYRINATDKRGSSELGPAMPEVVPDELGVRRRLISAVENGVDRDGIFERFGRLVPESVIDATLAKARAEGLRGDGLPLGIPA